MAEYGTSVDEVYDRALMMIQDYRIDKLATLNPNALSTYLRGLLINGISEFDLNDVLGELTIVKKETSDDTTTDDNTTTDDTSTTTSDDSKTTTDDTKTDDTTTTTTTTDDTTSTSDTSKTDDTTTTTTTDTTTDASSSDTSSSNSNGDTTETETEEEWYFTRELTANEKSILAKTIAYFWVLRIQNDAIALRNQMSNKQFKQLQTATTMKNRSEYLDKMKEEIDRDITKLQLNNLSTLSYFGDN